MDLHLACEDKVRLRKKFKDYATMNGKHQKCYRYHNKCTRSI